MDVAVGAGSVAVGSVGVAFTVAHALNANMIISIKIFSENFIHSSSKILIS
jgi:hypothetical protein